MEATPVIRWTAALLWPVAVLVWLAAPSHADIGGNPVGPGPCDYPFTGITAFFNPLLGKGELAYCRGPQEINGSYYVQALGDYSIAGGGAGSHGGSVVLGVGGGGTKTGFFCLADRDNGLAFLDPAKTQKAADPNPPGQWKSHIDHYEICKPVVDVPPPPPDAPPTDSPPYQPPAGNLDPSIPQPDNVTPPK